MYKFKEAARRGSALLAAAGLLAGIGASAMPALVSADALNPLTQRSLMLSSSSPGWSYKDGSGNITYAPPNSGANGQKTGEAFSFNTSTATAGIQAFTFQYCTRAAGQCLAPGDDGWTTGSPDTRNADSTSHTDLNVVSPSSSEISDWSTIQARTSTSNPGVEFAKTPLANGSEGNYIVLVDGVQSTGWTMGVGNLETGTIGAGTATGRNNLITLTNSTPKTITAGQHVQVEFFGTDNNYITNPGSSAFFVKINDFNTDTNTDTGQPDDGHALDPTQSAHIVDGGVTVANVMNESISIQTKVLETMDFSVGTVDPDTLTAGASSELATATANARVAHGPCDPILTGLNPTQPHNVLSMGSTIAENSLQTDTSYATHSYWRLSSNSSGGATVYYTGHTLTNTENNQIAPIGTTAAAPLTGAPQFGLAIDNDTTGNFAVDYAGASNANENGADVTAASQGRGLDSGFDSVVSGAGDLAVAHDPQLAPLTAASTQYGGGKGGINASDSGGITSAFAFDANADSSAVPIASESSQVVNCVTAKMRYIANIAATTPAGIYTTKINYVASPQY